VQQALDMISADWALAGLLAQLLSALMAHAHVSAGQDSGVPVLVQADDTQTLLHVFLTLMLQTSIISIISIIVVIIIVI